MVCFSLCSDCKGYDPTWSPEDWVEWFMCRLHQEPWALGGVVVLGVFALGTLSLVIFALLYGCCRNNEEQNVMKKKVMKKGSVI